MALPVCVRHRGTTALSNPRAGQTILLASWLAWSTLSSGQAANLDEARKLYQVGQYLPCAEQCAERPTDAYPAEEWNLLHARALLAVGRYEQSESVISNALVRSENSIRLRLLGVDTANHSGRPLLAQTRLREIGELGSARLWAYREGADLITLGRVALRQGADPKTVLERLYQPARQADPGLRDAWQASGELALEKHDFALAAKTYTDALKQFPNDPDFLYGLGRAYQPSAPAKTGELLETALEHNENHLPSLLLIADHAIDAEEYDQAEKTLARALRVNPWHPEAWAYRAVLAHLRHDHSAEDHARNQALHFWKTNPRVDHLIGRKLSQNYRFAEGAACQRQALAFDPAFLPARRQLAEDLLRLGEEAEGWKLIEEVHQRDGYDVTAYNLVTLRGTLEKFHTVTNEHFVVRMSAAEAALYGDRALALLERARQTLTARYGLDLASPTFIEIYPEQKDFAVRTFGLPGNPGFLGVCFGRVVTANSPASQAGRHANWEAVLWHEFCHVVTLQLTRNKMPRWLSEGISVYEELQANPAWGQTMNPRYREMILNGDLKPVGDLSSAFLTPKNGEYLQFAYYQSALVVEFLVERYGFDQLKAILRDLGQGGEVNEIIARHTAPLKEIESGFAAFAQAKAQALAPGLDWSRPDAARRALNRFRPEGVPPLPAPPLAANEPASSQGNNYWNLLAQATSLVADRKWAEAKAPLQTLLDLYPNQPGSDNAYALLAAVHRGLDETLQERAALEKWAASDGDALDAYLRLLDLALTGRDWPVVVQNAGRALAVNPLLAQPYRALGRAEEELGNLTQAAAAYRKLLLLDPADPAEVHFQLARLLRRQGHPDAKRHVLLALEEAPRFHDAYRLLLELTGGTPP